MPAAFISDGYTRTDTIPATRRHPEMRITYRPMTRAERHHLAMRVGRLLEQKKEREAAEVTAAAIAEKLVEWDAGEGTPAIDAATVGKLEPHLFEKIYRAIGGDDDESREDESEKNS